MLIGVIGVWCSSGALRATHRDRVPTLTLEADMGKPALAWVRAGGVVKTQADCLAIFGLCAPKGTLGRAYGLRMAILLAACAEGACLGCTPELPKVMVQDVPTEAWVMGNFEAEGMVITVPPLERVAPHSGDYVILVVDHLEGSVGKEVES